MNTSRFFVVLCGRFRGEDSDGISEHFVGDPFGWPPAPIPDHQAQVKDLLQNGVSVAA